MTAVAIDPTIQDYDVANGRPAHDISGGLMNSIVIRILTPLGSYWADAAIGSKLYMLMRTKDLPRVSVLASQYCQQALQPLIDDGRATTVSVETEQPGNGWLRLRVTVTAATGERLTFVHPVRVGA